MMCYVVCMCIQALSHPSQTHISCAKNTEGKKTPFYHFSLVVKVCDGAVQHMGMRTLWQPESKFPCQTSVSSLRILPLLCYIIRNK